MYLDLLLYCFVTALFCIGFYGATEKGNILHFIKKPVLDEIENLEKWKAKRLSEINEMELGDLVKYEKDQNPYDTQRKYFRDIYDNQIKRLQLIFKPVFLCPRCMASFWSLTIYLPMACVNYGIYFGVFSLLQPCLLPQL